MKAPHALCPDCRHFVCNHAGYPGRTSTSNECTVMSMKPAALKYNEIEKCKCTRTAESIK
jgi:hypothetical protein